MSAHEEQMERDRHRRKVAEIHATRDRDLTHEQRLYEANLAQARARRAASSVVADGRWWK